MGGAADAAVALAARACADPAAAIARWKALTGRKAVAILSHLVPCEVVEAAGMLPVSLRPGSRSGFPIAMGPWADGFVVARRGACEGPAPGERLAAGMADRPSFVFGIPEAGNPRAGEAFVDSVEAFVEWAGSVSGRPVREGDVERSSRIANDSRRRFAGLEALMAGAPGFVGAAELAGLAGLAAFCPSAALSRILRFASTPGKRRKASGGPRLFLAGVSPSPGIAQRIDSAGAAVCGADLVEGRRLRGALVDEDGDAVVSIARSVQGNAAAFETGVDCAAKVLREAADCGAERLLLLWAGGDDGERACLEALGREAADSGLATLGLGIGAPLGEEDARELGEFLGAG